MNIAFLGCSKIANKAIQALKSIDDITLYACSARDFERAKNFASKHNIMHAYSSYEEMLQDDKIDLVYISTLSSSHYKDTMLAMKHNKNCIVEKPLATNLNDVKKIFQYSEKHNIYVTEALLGRFHPSKKVIKEILNSNIIGDAYHIEANLSFPLTHIEHLNNLEMGGGVLLDLGVYPLNFACMLFGYNIKKISALQVIDKSSRVDRSNFINIVFDDNHTASLNVSMEVLSKKEAIIYCKNGYIEVENFNNPTSVKIYRNMNERTSEIVKELSVSGEVNGYEYEFIDVFKELKMYQIESDNFTHYEIDKIYEIIDFINKNSLKVEN